MLKIGDFSKLGQVSIKTLRYYDQIGLLAPSHIDAFTSYRYYSVGQLARLNRILAFKDLGFSLEQIAQLLDENLPPAQIRGMLRLKQAEIEQHLAEDQDRLARIETRLRQIEQEDQRMAEIEVLIKKVTALHVAALRDVVANYGAQGVLWQELEAYLAGHKVSPAGPCLTIDHNEEYKEQDVDLEVCEPIDADLPATDRICIYSLPEVDTMACLIMTGGYELFPKTYRELIRWIGVNGYQIVGPSREIYHRNHEHTEHPAEFVTEVQFPVVKA